MTSAPTDRTIHPRPVFVAVVAVFTGQQLLTPLLPALATRLGLDALAIGVVLGPPLGGLLAGAGLELALYAPAVIVLAVGGLARRRAAAGGRRCRRRRAAAAESSRLPRLAVPGSGLRHLLTLTASQVTLGFLVQDRSGLAPGPAAQGTGLLLVPRLGWPPRRLVLAGTVAGIPACAVLAVAADLGTLAAALAVSGVGVGLAAAGFMSAPTLLVPARDRGAVAGFLAAAPYAADLRPRSLVEAMEGRPSAAPPEFAPEES